MTSTLRPGTVELTEFASTKMVGDGIWAVQEHDAGNQLNIVVERPQGLIRLFGKTFQEVYPLDSKEWSKDGMVYRTRQANSGLPGGTAGAYGVYHVEIGEILPRPAGYEFDPNLHMMPKVVVHLTPTLFLLDHKRLLETCGDHVKFSALPFSVSVKGQVHVDQESKRILVAAKSDGGVRAMLFDYDNGVILQEVKF